MSMMRNTAQDYFNRRDPNAEIIAAQEAARAAEAPARAAAALAKLDIDFPPVPLEDAEAALRDREREVEQAAAAITEVEAQKKATKAEIEANDEQAQHATAEDEKNFSDANATLIYRLDKILPARLEAANQANLIALGELRGAQVVVATAVIRKEQANIIELDAALAAKLAEWGAEADRMRAKTAASVEALRTAMNQAAQTAQAGGQQLQRLYHTPARHSTADEVVAAFKAAVDKPAYDRESAPRRELAERMARIKADVDRERFEHEQAAASTALTLTMGQRAPDEDDGKVDNDNF